MKEKLYTQEEVDRLLIEELEAVKWFKENYVENVLIGVRGVKNPSDPSKIINNDDMTLFTGLDKYLQDRIKALALNHRKDD